MSGDKGKALIHSVVVAVYQSKYEPGMPFYAPRQVQIEVGDSPSHFHYKSPVFDAKTNTDSDQVFCLFPHVVVGEYVKVVFIGKPQI